MNDALKPRLPRLVPGSLYRDAEGVICVFGPEAMANAMDAARYVAGAGLPLRNAALDPEVMRQRSADMQAASVRAARTAYSQDVEPVLPPEYAWMAEDKTPAWRAPVVAMVLLLLIAAAVHFLFRHWSH